MLDKTVKLLKTRGYQVIQRASSVVMLRESIDRVYVILLTEYNDRVSPDVYIHVFNNLLQSYRKLLPKPVSVLNLCFSQDAMFSENELKLANEIQGIWLIAKDTGKLYAFENQPLDFDGLYSVLETETTKLKTRLWFIPGATIGLVFINLAVFFAMNMLLSEESARDIICKYGMSWTEILEHGSWYRLLTSMFLHSDMEHIYGNMLLLFFVGMNMEEWLGHGRFLLLYLSTGLFADVGSAFYHYMKLDTAISIGASGAIMGLLGAMAGIIYLSRGRLKKFSLRRLFIYFGLTVMHGLLTPHIDNAAHIAGFFAGLLFALLCYRNENEKKQTI